MSYHDFDNIALLMHAVFACSKLLGRNRREPQLTETLT